MYASLLLISAIPVLAYGFVLYCMIRLARKQVPGASLVAIGSVIMLLGDLLNGFWLMATVLPNFVHDRNFVFPVVVKLFGFLCLACGVSKLTDHVLSIGKTSFSAANNDRLSAQKEQTRDASGASP